MSYLKTQLLDDDETRRPWPPVDGSDDEPMEPTTPAEDAALSGGFAWDAALPKEPDPVPDAAA